MRPRTGVSWPLVALLAGSLLLVACDGEESEDEAAVDEPAGEEPGDEAPVDEPADEEPPEEPPAELRVGSEAVGFRVADPGSWLEMDPGEFGYDPAADLPQATSFAFFVDPEACSPEFCPNINVFTEPSFGINLGDYTSQTVAQTEAQGGEILQREEAELGGHPAYEVHYQVVDGMESLGRWMITDDDEALVFTFTAESEDFDDLVDGARDFLDAVEVPG